MSVPDPQAVREIAAKVANIALHDAVHVDQWISAVIGSDFGNECSQVRAPLHAAVARRMATVRPSWPDEQQPADVVTAEQQQPWPRAQRMPLAVVGGRPQPWHYQAIAEYGAATGTALEPNPTIPGGYTATQVNWAITWWNERVAAEQQQDGAAGRLLAWLDFSQQNRPGYDHLRDVSYTKAPVCDADLRAVLAERTALAEQLAAATARAESATVLPERWRALITERDAATARAEKAEAEATRLRAVINEDITAYETQLNAIHEARDYWQDQTVKATEERDEARELARASLDILRNVSDEPMHELFEVDDMDELPGWFTGYGKPGDTEAPDACRSCGETERVAGDPPLCSNCAAYGATYRGVACWPPIAAPDGRSGPVERSEEPR
jgi:chorismate mutase